MFFKCKTTEEVKALYKKLARRVHPDFGGCHDLMCLLTEAYEERLKIITKHKKKFETNEYEEGNEYEEAFDCEIRIEEPDERLKILEDIEEYATTHPKFDTTYIENLRGFLSMRGYLTSAQYNKLVKIFYSFRMNEKKKK